jgi:hypothetical protein
MRGRMSYSKIIAGLCLIGFPLAGVISSLIDANEGTGMSGADLYQIAVAHHDAIMAAALIFMVSAVLTVPAVFGLLRLARGRGSIATQLGAALVVIGAFGHMGFAVWQMMLAKVPTDTDSAAMIAFLDRTAVVTNVLLPMLIAIAAGLVLLAFGLYRARFAPAWVPAVIAAAVVAELALDSTSVGDSKWLPVVIWAMGFIAYGYLGALVLRLTDEEWSNPREAVAEGGVDTRSAAASGAV